MARRRRSHLYRDGADSRERRLFEAEYGHQRGDYVYGAVVWKVRREREARYAHAHPHGSRHHGGRCAGHCRRGRSPHVHRRGSRLSSRAYSPPAAPRLGARVRADRHCRVLDQRCWSHRDPPGVAPAGDRGLDGGGSGWTGAACPGRVAHCEGAMARVRVLLAALLAASVLLSLAPTAAASPSLPNPFGGGMRY